MASTSAGTSTSTSTSVSATSAKRIVEPRLFVQLGQSQPERHVLQTPAQAGQLHPGAQTPALATAAPDVRVATPVLRVAVLFCSLIDSFVRAQTQSYVL